jgi:hypothetical protein
MSAASRYEGMRSDILQRLDSIEARLAAVIDHGRRILVEAVGSEPIKDDPVGKLDAIEAKLEALEKQLYKIDAEMREKESPPASFAPTFEFSEGPHYPGLG